jgi:7,8-dihydropterin-6-yl-methyl-4-(beta-D-ribofuranosyl)aminobenzene 5'-phosphate synthase
METFQKMIVTVGLLLTLSQLAVTQNIFEAVGKNDIEMITSLIKKNPEYLNQREEKSGLTPLLKATSTGQIEICKLLIKNGADFHATDNLQGTTLHLAAYFGHQKLIKLYIDKGIDVNARDNNGYTPLIWAISGKDTNIIEELVKHGAELNPPIRIGRSVLHLAAANGNTDVLKYLLNKGLNIGVKSDYGNTPLFWALRARKYDNVKFLIENGSELNVINNLGHTPLSFVISNNDTTVVDLLIQKGKNIHKKNHSGDTHLHAAAYQGNKEIVKLLLEKGANPNYENKNGLTALDLAIKRDNPEVQQLLQSAGAKSGKSKEKKTTKLTSIKNIGPGINNPVKLTIIYDNYVHKDGMENDWGFSCFIEGTEKNILFDTGTKSDLFSFNIKNLNVDQSKIDIVVISHEHGDHTGGLFDLLEMNSNASVFLPYSFSYNFVRKVESYGAKTIAVKNPVEICKDVYLCGEMGGRIKEQSLAINTKKGLIIICGCSHPGIINIIKKFKETLNKDVYQVLGGFHLMNKTEPEMNEIIDQMKIMGVKKCSATHCTGKKQIQMIKEAFGDHFISMGVGREITF